ncbi:MAG TPA: hypothetical protein VFB60_11395 [Ktedonobacteraceae bacterium]|nr:hypothetical protein [Ktedonobacteraceae bacterium]
MKELIHLLNGTPMEAEVTGRSLDGKTGYVAVVPPGNYPTFEAYILASFLTQVVRRSDGSWEEVGDVQNAR